MRLANGSERSQEDSNMELGVGDACAATKLDALKDCS